jgi:hypothetical protein
MHFPELNFKQMVLKRLFNGIVPGARRRPGIAFES